MQLIKKLSFCLLLLCIIQYKTSGQYSAEIKKVLAGTKNHAELEKALNHFYKIGNQLKIKAINFLVVNMPIHYSASYYWADEKGNRIDFNEMNYPSFADAVKSFEVIKSKAGKLHPVPYRYRDVDSIKADMLISDVEMAAKFVKNEKFTSSKEEMQFLEYVLPYRTSVEPLQNWRKLYNTKFAGLITNTDPVDKQAVSIGKNIKGWFTNTYKIEERSEPLPRLGALQLLSRKKGACEDIAGLAAFMARSQGIPAAVDFVPAWATASGEHFLTFIDISPRIKHHYDASDGYVLDTLAREPAKVIRTTYSIRPETVAYQLNNDTAQIPNSFMRSQNYIDVTPEFWQTEDVNIPLFHAKKTTPAFVYAAVWNQSAWKPVWYAKVLQGETATFKSMCIGAVYLPTIYVKGKLIPAGWPVVNNSKNKKILKPKINEQHTIYLKEEPRYLAFRKGKKYKLFFWNINRWEPLGSKTADSDTNELAYENVPKNALLLLIPEYTQGKERPFEITDTDKRIWY